MLKQTLKKLVDDVRKLAETDKVQNATRNGETPVQCSIQRGNWAVEYFDGAIELYHKRRNIASFDPFYALRRREVVMTLKPQTKADDTGCKYFAEVLGNVPIQKGWVG